MGTFALELRTNSHNLIMKNDATCDVTNQSSEILRKRNTDRSHVTYEALYIKISVMVLF